MSQKTAPIRSTAQTMRLSDLVKKHASDLSAQLARHQATNFPPESRKSFRCLSPTETFQLLGIAEGYLRQVAAKCDAGSPDPATKRRMYSLEDIAALRAELNKNPRESRRYLPHRRIGEHLQIITTMNFKGGSGKTTTAAHLVQHLAMQGYRTLAIDLDPQASLSTLLGVTPEIDVTVDQSIYGAIRHLDPLPLSRIVRRTYIPSLDLVPANLELMEFEHEAPRVMVNASATTVFFDRVLEAIRDVEADYDVVVIDCPPQLGYLALSALMAATAVLITVHPQMLDVMSMAQFLTMTSALLDVVAEASQRQRGDSYDWMRYLITRYEPSDGPQTQMAAFLRSIFGENVLIHPALKSTAISDAGLTNQTIYEVDRTQFTRATYDRALESIRNVNAEIEGLVKSAWGRP